MRGSPLIVSHMMRRGARRPDLRRRQQTWEDQDAVGSKAA
jgi:hypothetical protein